MIEILLGDKLIQLSPNQSIYTIGRDTSCDIQISDRTISRRHAALYKDEEQEVTITDGDLVSNRPSANGVRVNGVPLDPSHGQILNDGDVVELSPSVSFKFFCKEVDVTDEQSTLL